MTDEMVFTSQDVEVTITHDDHGVWLQSDTHGFIETVFVPGELIAQVVGAMRRVVS